MLTPLPQDFIRPATTLNLQREQSLDWEKLSSFEDTFLFDVADVASDVLILDFIKTKLEHPTPETTKLSTLSDSLVAHPIGSRKDCSDSVSTSAEPEEESVQQIQKKIRKRKKSLGTKR